MEPTCIIDPEERQLLLVCNKIADDVPCGEPPSRISDSAEARLDLTSDLIDFVRDVASWSDTVDGPLDYGDFEDLENLGRRAHDLEQRIREAMEL